MISNIFGGGAPLPISLLLSLTLRLASPVNVDADVDATIVPDEPLNPEYERTLASLEYDALEPHYEINIDEPRLPDVPDKPRIRRRVLAAVAPRVATAGIAPLGPAIGTGKKVRVSVTAYCSDPRYTDNSPFTTASGQRVAPHIVATNFLPFNTKIGFPELGGFSGKTFVVGDRMNKRFWYTVDLWFATCQEARQFGKKATTLEILQ